MITRGTKEETTSGKTIVAKWPRWLIYKAKQVFHDAIFHTFYSGYKVVLS